MPRVVVSDKYPNPKSNPNKMMTRSAAAAAAATSSTANTSTEDLSAGNDRPSTSGPAASSGSASTSTAAANNPPRPEPASSPAKCAICLENLSNRCYTNSCIHQFCFGCLLEWSKIKAECPLCKSNFQSIYHNIRNNDDYDEYIIPPPTNIVPHLSIRLTTEGFRAQLPTFRFDEPLPAHALLAHSSSPFHDHGYSFQRLVRERERERRQHQNNSYIRILEMGPFTEPRAIDFVNYSSRPTSRAVLDNPFYTDEPELFGSVDDNATRLETDTSLRGYQNRKRIYDRFQFVQPFAATLPAGTVFFPSVEYFQTHPSALSRVSAWLYREIMVLMGIQRSRNEMGYVYDLILSILSRYDIRSRDFRETISSHFGVRTRHFQHEFYHFLISGMLMEEYDRVAHYTAPSPSNPSAVSTLTSATFPSRHARSTATAFTCPSSTANTNGTGTDGRPVAPQSPLVVTIDSSSDTESESDGSIETLNWPSAEVAPNNAAEARQIQRNLSLFPGHSVPPESDIVTRIAAARADRLVPQSPTMLPTSPPIPSCRRSAHPSNPFRNTTDRASDITPRPILEAIHPNRSDFAPSSTASWRRSPWVTFPARQPPAAHTNAPPSAPSTFEFEPVLRPNQDFAAALASLHRFRPGQSQTSPSRRSARLSYYPPAPPQQPMDGHRYAPTTTTVIDDFEIPPTTATRNDLERPRCPVETGYPTYDERLMPRPERYSSTSARTRNQLMYIYGQPQVVPLPADPRSRPGDPRCVRRVSSHADPVTNVNPDGTLRRSTAVHHCESDTSAATSSSTNAVAVAEALIKLTNAGPSSSCSAAPTAAVSTVQSDDDEIEMLGIHPVVKPPPLAVITLSSDEEEEKPKQSKSKVEKLETNTGAGTSSSTTAWVTDLLPLATTSASVPVNIGDVEGESNDVIFESEQAAADLRRNYNDNDSSVLEIFEAARKRKESKEEYEKREMFEAARKRKEKYEKRIKLSSRLLPTRHARHTSPSSDSSSSENEIYVDSLVDNKMKLKRKKVPKKSLQNSSSAEKMARKRRRKHEEDEEDVPEHELRRRRQLAKYESYGPLTTQDVFGFRKETSSDSDEDGSDDWGIPHSSKRKRKGKPLTSPDIPTWSRSRWNSTASAATGPLNIAAPMPMRNIYSSGSVGGPAAAAAMPSTMPGIGILDLRKLMEEKQQQNSGTGVVRVAPSSSATIAGPSRGVLPRWESEASEGEKPIEVNDTSSDSDSDCQKPMWPVTKARALLRSSEEESNNINDDDDSSSSDTQCNSRETTRNGSITGRGSFFIPNQTESTRRVTVSPLQSALELVPAPRSTTFGETLDLRVTQNPALLNPWRDDPIIGSFVDADARAVDLLDLSMQEPSPLEFLEGDWAQGEGSSRRPSIDESSDNGSRLNHSDWFGW